MPPLDSPRISRRRIPPANLSPPRKGSHNRGTACLGASFFKKKTKGTFWASSRKLDQYIARSSASLAEDLSEDPLLYRSSFQGIKHYEALLELNLTMTKQGISDVLAGRHITSPTPPISKGGAARQLAGVWGRGTRRHSPGPHSGRTHSSADFAGAATKPSNQARPGS